MDTNQVKNIILKSKFFRVPMSLTKEQLLLYCQLWWPLQAEFSLGLVALTGDITRKLLVAIREKDFDAENLLREILAWQSPAAMDELGIGRIKSETHDLLFRIQMEKAGIDVSLVEKYDVNIAPHQLVELRNLIAKAFGNPDNIVVGLCMMYTVETIAPELFALQRLIFLNAGIRDEALVHSNTHVALEGKHAGEAAEFYSALRKYGSAPLIWESMEKFANAWKVYLDRVAFEVYGE